MGFACARVEEPTSMAGVAASPVSATTTVAGADRELSAHYSSYLSTSS